MILGAILMVIGLVLYWLHFRHCYWLVQTTKNFPEPLTITETWLNTRSETKQHKLLSLSASDDPEIKSHAILALRFYTAFFSLFGIGMAIFFFGAVAAKDGT